MLFWPSVKASSGVGTGGFGPGGLGSVLELECEPDFARRVCAAMDDLPPDWDVMLIGALGLVHPERKYGLWWLVHFLPQLLFLPASGMRWRPRVSDSVHG